jgi:hypothetical protein
MQEKIVTSVGDLHDLASSLASGHPIFRGVRDASYELLTRFGRSMIGNKKFREKNKDFSFILDSGYEKVVLTEFKNQSTP